MIALVEGEEYNIFAEMNDAFFECMDAGKSVALEEDINYCSMCDKTFWVENLIEIPCGCVCKHCYFKYKRG